MTLPLSPYTVIDLTRARSGPTCVRQLADMGAVIAPIMPAFYNRPQTVDDIINHTVGRLLDLFGIDNSAVKRWHGGREVEVK